ncbi:hypothetical protein E3P99_01314 [Wallemia hederae]|uniref:Uncharacterized protein n=1 Tax=Wallemia hederae TaxID=1540922 RepID=A0A4T0FQD7_9BASI|nr:hypothetical protein E3P99_01314 [Wallemia hederae]
MSMSMNIGIGSSKQYSASHHSIDILSSSATTFDPFTAYAPSIEMSVSSTQQLCASTPAMRVDILKKNSVIAVLHLSITSDTFMCSTRDDLIQQDLDLLPSEDGDRRIVGRRPFELASGKMPPVSYVGGRVSCLHLTKKIITNASPSQIRSQGALHPYATFESSRSLFKKDGKRIRHELVILDDTRVTPTTAFILIIANQAYHRCVWGKHLDALARQNDLTQYHKAQGMIFNPAVGAGVLLA